MFKVTRVVQHSPALLRIVICLLVTVLLASPLFFPLYRFEYAATEGKTVIWAPIALFGVFVLVLPVWLRRIHGCRRPWQTLGLVGGQRWWQGWALSFAVGIVGVACLYGIQLFLGWGRWGPLTDTNLTRNLLEGLLVGLGVGLAEELIFRGWLLFELEQNYAAPLALGLNAGIFAIAHFIRPLSEILASWPQFAGLFLLGCALVWARRVPIHSAHGPKPITSLAPPAGLHAGLVFAYYQVDVNDLVSPTNQVPAWVTGIGGNPLSGLLGLGLLGAIAYATYVASHPQQG